MAIGSTQRRLGAWLSVWLVLLLGLGTLVAPADQARGAHVLRVVATTTQSTDLARNVAGTAARVDGILSANVDPHDYEPVPSDLTKIAAAYRRAPGNDLVIGARRPARAPGDR